MADFHDQTKAEANTEATGDGGEERSPFFVYVENLAYACTIDDLGDFFYENKCIVNEVEVDRGHGRVFFEDQESKELALTLTNLELFRVLRKSYSRCGREAREESAR